MNLRHASSAFLATVVVVFVLGACDSGSSTSHPEVSEGAPPEEAGSDVEGTATVTIHPGEDRSPISPYVYGSNQDRSDTDVWTVRRLGGNRMTGYNWETNHSNAGSDWQHSNDNFLLDNAGIPESEWDESARVMTHFHEESLDGGAETVLTLQMAGYVAADDEGTVSEAETAPSPRWDSVEYRKAAAFAEAPTLDDGSVYMDELVHFLTQRYGKASAADGVRWYTLDNEPALWSDTHPRIHPEKTEAQELVDRTVELASAVKAVDPNSRITGPVLYGFGAYLDLQGAPDWNAVSQGYDWFIDYYLDRMQEAEQTHGQRLLDVLDVHWYPEAQGDNRIVDSGATTAADVEARLQAPRTLWDSTYTEESWIAEYCGEYLPILPRLRRAIDEYYPRTKLAITEYDYGAKHTISGGLAQADVLGAFGRYGVDVATLWGIGEEDDYAAAAFRLYRNYNGNGGTYGNTSVRARTDDRTNTSVYAAIEDDTPSRLHVVLINKNREGPLQIQFNLQRKPSYAEGEAWRFDAERASIEEDEAFEKKVDLSGDSFTYVVPRTSATHLILRTD